jgi:hypothetical protein
VAVPFKTLPAKPVALAPVGATVKIGVHFYPFLATKEGVSLPRLGSETPCWWSTIRSVGNCSGIMSVNERIDIDHKGTEQITDSKRGIGEALAHARSSQDNGSV